MSQIVKSKDGVLTQLKELQRKNKTLDEEQEYFIKTDNILRLSDYYEQIDSTHVYQYTITLDPSFFKYGLISEYTQRQYIKSALWLTLKKFNFQSMFGCFELHKSGIVHSHVIFNSPETEPTKVLNFIVPLFTKRSLETQHAIRADFKESEEAFNYITKEESKSQNYDNNYFYYIFQKKSLNL